MTAINTDTVLDALARAGEAVTCQQVCDLLGTRQEKKVRGCLIELVRDETARKVGARYALREAGKHETPGNSTATPRRSAPTRTPRVGEPAYTEAQNDKNRAASRIAQTLKHVPPVPKVGKTVLPPAVTPSPTAPTPIRSIEDAEQAVEAQRMAVATPEKDDDFKLALQRLDRMAIVPPLVNVARKVLVLAKLEPLVEASICTELEQLRAWLQEVTKTPEPEEIDA